MDKRDVVETAILVACIIGGLFVVHSMAQILASLMAWLLVTVQP